MPDTVKADAAKSNVTDALIQEVNRELDGYEAQRDKINGKIKACRKKAKADGVKLNVLDDIRKMRAADPEELIEDEIARQRYAKAINLDLSKAVQASLDLPPVDPKTLETQREYDAMRDGRRFGLRGDPADQNPFAPGTVAFAAWETGRQDGIAEREATGGTNKRGRPKKEVTPTPEKLH